MPSFFIQTQYQINTLDSYFNFPYFFFSDNKRVLSILETKTGMIVKEIGIPLSIPRYTRWAKEKDSYKPTNLIDYYPVGFTKSGSLKSKLQLLIIGIALIILAVSLIRSFR